MNKKILDRYETLITNKNVMAVQHIKQEVNLTTIYGPSANENKIYIPSETGKAFHADDSFVKIVMGPYGSGKSTMCLQTIVDMACAMPAWRRGRRKSKWIIIRNTSGELTSTTLPSWLLWFDTLGVIRKREKPLLTYFHTFDDGKGIVELELVFIALDKPKDVGKIRSLEATGVYINELSEVPEIALSDLKGRVNHRYPSRAFCAEPYWSGIIADTNPPDKDHWIYKNIECLDLKSYKIFHQPQGLLKDHHGDWYQNPDCDNYNNLAPDYYLKLAEGQTEDYIKVFCLGEYGTVGFGKLVYPEYNDDIHSVPVIPAIQGEPIHLGWDFGLTPACVVIQFSSRGQFRILKEYTVKGMGIRRFAESIVIPALRRDFPYCKIGTSRADPSGTSPDEIMEELSCIGELNSLGITTLPADTNLIAPRLAAVRYFLNIMTDGQPGLIVSREGAPVIRKGFAKDYTFKRLAVRGEERYHDKPDKNHASHPHDGLQYIALEFAAKYIASLNAPENPIDMFNPGFRHL